MLAPCSSSTATTSGEDVVVLCSSEVADSSVASELRRPNVVGVCHDDFRAGTAVSFHSLTACGASLTAPTVTAMPMSTVRKSGVSDPTWTHR
jgi:hypothetical protein